LEALYIPPPELLRTELGDSIVGPDYQGTTKESAEYLDDSQAAHLVIICIHVLSALGDSHSPLSSPAEYEPALRLAKRLVRGIAARVFFDNEIADSLGERKELDILSGFLTEVKDYLFADLNSGRFLYWLTTVFLEFWDGSPEIHTWSTTGISALLIHALSNMPNPVENEIK
jgi:hypothetical protein